MSNLHESSPGRGRWTTAILLAVFGVILTGTVATAADMRKQILLINSYHQNFTWNEKILQGINQTLRPQESGILIHVENMDTKRVAYNEQYDKQLEGVYSLKYKDTDLALIMVTDNNAFEFMRRHHHKLFPKVPVVFCGVNNFRNEMIRDHPLFTGVAGTADVRGTLWWALKFHPDTKTIYIINDYSPAGLSMREMIKRDLNGSAPGVNIRYSHDQTMLDLLGEVKRLPPNSLVLFGTYNRDKSGTQFGIGEAVSTISRNSPVPVYGLMDYDLGHGIVGGMLTSGHSQGRFMAQVAMNVLAGRHPRDIAVITQGVSRPMFDFNQLERYGINIEELPDDAEIINLSPAISAENLKLIWVGAIFTVIQMVIILLLIANTARRRQAEKALRKAHQSLEERVRDRTSELKRSEEALRTIFDASHDAIFIHNVTGKILDGNERMLKMYRLNRSEVEDISIARDISSRDNAVYRLSSLWRSVLNGEPQFFEWKGRRPHDGSEFDAEVYLNRIVYRGEEAILANVRDITVRKESENRIRQSLSKFEAILENSLMGIAMSHGRTLSTINRRGAEIFGYTPGELIGNELSVILGSPDEVETFVSASRKALTQSGEFNTEQEFFDKDGNTIWCRMYAKAVAPDSLDKGVIWAWDDITDHRRNQEDLMRTREEAEAANRAKSEFLAAMSHEIRTPMNAIVGMTDILLQTRLADDQRDYLKTVMDSAQHLLSIINDILDLSKIEARKLTLDRVDFDLGFHVRSTIKGLEVQAQQKDLSLTLDIDESLTVCVKGDPLSLRQVLMNLVGNAIKFTHRGTITVRVRKAEPIPHRPEDDPRTLGFLFEVQDTGIGIPEEFMESIFQSFSQSTRAFGGTGLGLAICKRLISLMDGDICVASEVGKGSIFSFTVWMEPGVSCPVPSERHEGLSALPPHPIHVLVAEDNDVNVMVTTMRLEEMGCTYSVAANGLEALDLLKREPFDLVLMDIEMPVLDGISATKAIRSAVSGGAIPNPNIPIIGVTAHALREFRVKSLDAGMDDYVSKPVDFNELAIIIGRLVGTPAQTRETLPSPTATAPKNDMAVPEEQIDEELPVWSPDKAIEDLGVDEGIFADFVITARSELDMLIQEIRQSMGENDAKTAGLCHTVKSICLSVGAHLAALAAADLETACREQGCSEEKMEILAEEIRRLVDLMK